MKSSRSFFVPDTVPFIPSLAIKMVPQIILLFEKVSNLLFRIFNPVTQGEKFDSDGEYIRKYIPEIKALPNKYLFCPWEAPKEELDKAGILLGHDYPNPVIDLKESRQKALDAFKSLKKAEE